MSENVDVDKIIFSFKFEAVFFVLLMMHEEGPISTLRSNLFKYIVEQNYHPLPRLPNLPSGCYPQSCASSPPLLSLKPPRLP